MENDYSRYQDPDYASDTIKIMSLQFYFADRRRNPNGMDRATAQKLSRRNPDAWRNFISSLKSERSRLEITQAVERTYGLKLFPETSTQAA